MRSELDLEAVLRVAVEETGMGVRVTRCFLRLGEPGGPMPIRAEWDAEGFVPIGGSAERLAVSNLAARERRTIAISDVRDHPELDDVGGIQTLLDLDTLAVLATPVLVFDRMIGIFGFHRSEPGEWSVAEISSARSTSPVRPSITSTAPSIAIATKVPSGLIATPFRPVRARAHMTLPDWASDSFTEPSELAVASLEPRASKATTSTFCVCGLKSRTRRPSRVS